MNHTRLGGRPSHYRGKLADRPIVISLTPEGHAALAHGVRVSGLSRADYIERLLRRKKKSASQPTV